MIFHCRLLHCYRGDETASRQLMEGAGGLFSEVVVLPENSTIHLPGFRISNARSAGALPLTLA